VCAVGPTLAAFASDEADEGDKLRDTEQSDGLLGKWQAYKKRIVTNYEDRVRNFSSPEKVRLKVLLTVGGYLCV
jgi:hypothetical protein